MAPATYEYVLTATPDILDLAEAFLGVRGIRARHSSPSRGEGILRVDREAAERARELLRDEFGQGRIITATEASFFRCHSCEEPLTLGQTWCSNCGAFVGDPHGT